MKIFKWILVVVLTIGVVFGIGMFNILNGFAKEIDAIEIDDIDVSSVADGVYLGSHNINDALVVEVEVTVFDGKIISVAILRHENGRGDAAESLADVIVSEQTIKVDAVSGATGSSRVIMKACENALKKGL